MSFNIVIALQGGRDAESGIARIETGLDKTSDAAGRVRDTLGRFAATGADAGARVAKGADDAAKAHGRAKDAAEAQGDALSTLIHLAEAYVAVHQVKEVVDGYVEISNRLRVVASDQDNLNGLLEATLGIAQDTRSAWDTVSSTYQRLSNVTHGLGLSQQHVLDLTRELAIGAKVSGASAQESAAAQAELTHAFATGALQGREFRVLMRDVPALMHELQVASSKTGAEFAEMGKHGQITAQLLIDWFGKAEPALTEKFGRTVPTIADGFTRIHNAAQAFFGDAAVASGTLGTLSAAMAFVADHFEAFAKAVLGVGEALVALFVIDKVVGLVKALTAAIAANPLGALLTAITVGISLLRQFGAQIETHIPVWTNIKGVFVTVGDELDALWAQLKKLGAEIMAFLGEAWRALTQSFSQGLDSDGMELSLDNILRLVAGFVGALRGLFHVMAEDSNKTFALMAYGMTEAMVTAANAAIHAIEAVASAPRRALFDAMNHTVEKQADALEAAKKNFDDYLDKNGAHLAAMARYDLERKAAAGPDPLNAPGDPSHHVVTDQEVQREVARRGRGIYDAELVNEYAQRGLDERGQDPRNGQYRLYSDIENPLKGTPTEAIARSAIEDLKESAKAAMDDFDRTARDIAAQRVMDAKNHPAGGAISTATSAPEPIGPSDKDIKALEKLRNELRTILEQTNPVTAAQEKLAHAQDVVNSAVDKGLISWAQGATAMDNYRRKEADALDPMSAWVRKQIEAAAALRDTAEAQDRAAQLTSFEDELRKQGLVLTDQQIEQAKHLIEVRQQQADLMRAEQQFTQLILGPQKTYRDQLAALGDLLQRGRLSADQYGRAVDGVRAAYLAGTQNGKIFLGGLEQAWLKAKSDADAFGQTLANTVIADVDKLNDSLVTMANGGAVSWSAMVDSMIQDLERLILKQLEVAAVNAVISGVGGSPLVAGAVGATASAGATPDPGIPRVVPTAPTWGAYPGAAPATANMTSTARQIVRIIVVNQIDKSVPLAAIAGPAGQATVLNVMRANSAATRLLSGAGK